MTLILLQLLLLTASITYIWEHSGFISDLAKGIYNYTHPKNEWLGQPLRKPFGCYICMTFWLTFIVLLFNTSIIYALSLGCAYAITASVINKIMKYIFILINKF